MRRPVRERVPNSNPIPNSNSNPIPNSRQDARAQLEQKARAEEARQTALDGFKDDLRDVRVHLDGAQVGQKG